MRERENFLQLSGLQHFLFCRRQWALIHIEQQWVENVRTLEGRFLHEKAHGGADELRVARNSILGKVFNSRWVLERTVRDHAMRVNSDARKTASTGLKTACDDILQAGSAEELRGIEGKAAAQYFGVFNELVLQNKEEFRFTGRNRRPPLDRINALMSFVYTLLAHETAAALGAVGLDPYVGFFHADRVPHAQALLLARCIRNDLDEYPPFLWK